MGGAAGREVWWMSKGRTDSGSGSVTGAGGTSGRHSPEAQPSAGPSSGNRRSSSTGGVAVGGGRTFVTRTTGMGGGAGAGGAVGAAGRSVGTKGGRTGATSRRSSGYLVCVVGTEAGGEALHLRQQLGNGARGRQLDGLEQRHLQGEPGLGRARYLPPAPVHDVEEAGDLRRVRVLCERGEGGALGLGEV